MRRRFEAEAEAASKSGKDDDDDEEFLLLPCWRAVARKLRVASARDAQKEVLRWAGWETCVVCIVLFRFVVPPKLICRSKSALSSLYRVARRVFRACRAFVLLSSPARFA